MRGPHGGFRLAQEPSRVTLAAVVGPFDQLIEHRSCLLGRATCSDRTACAAHHAWKETADAVERFFRTTTIAEITGAPEILAGAPRSRSAPRSRRTA
jgi:Rrf2 family protein